MTDREDGAKTPLVQVKIAPDFEWIKHLQKRPPIWTVICLLIVVAGFTATAIGVAWAVHH